MSTVIPVPRTTLAVTMVSSFNEVWRATGEERRMMTTKTDSALSTAALRRRPAARLRVHGKQPSSSAESAVKNGHARVRENGNELGQEKVIGPREKRKNKKKTFSIA
jgi:hypothetical protein